MKLIPLLSVNCFRSKISILGAFVLVSFTGTAQVSISTDGSTADPSAMLDVKSNTKGVLIPRMSTVERTGIDTPADGLLVFDSDTGTFWFYNGTAWEEMAGTSQIPAPSVITPPLISASQHNFNPAGFGSATVIRISGNNGFQMITGFNAQPDGEDKTIMNVGSFPLYLAPEHSGSAAANRIAHFEEVVLPPGTSCRIIYDGTATRWRPVNPPCPNYRNIRHSVHYDKSAGKVPEGFQDDIHINVFGSLTQSTAPPSATSPFGAWNFNSGSSPSGGLGLFFPKSSEEMAYVSSTHMVTRAHFKTPIALGDATNNYYFIVRIADSPSSGFWDQNNSLGIRYRYDVNGGKWQCYSRSGSGTDAVADSGIAFDVNTEYELMVTLNKSNTEATYFINGTVVARINTNLPSATSLGATVQFEKTSGSSARAFLVYRFMAAAIAL